MNTFLDILAKIGMLVFGVLLAELMWQAIAVLKAAKTLMEVWSRPITVNTNKYIHYDLDTEKKA
jgi:hypothetical protein